MYFDHCQTVEEIKAEYRELALKNHPDVGGDTATMQAINAAYEKALQRMDGQTSNGTDGHQHTYHYNADIEATVMAKISEFLAAKIPNVELWLIGTWLWADGDTRPARAQLKALGFRWHNKRKKWYYTATPNRTRYNRKANLGDLADKYGARNFKQEEEPALTT
jgi:hypothetical protein